MHCIVEVVFIIVFMKFIHHRRIQYCLALYVLLQRISILQCYKSSFNIRVPWLRNQPPFYEKGGGTCTSLVCGCANAWVIEDSSCPYDGDATVQSVTNTANPRAWLETQSEGAYTVVRCDYDNRMNCWKIWGREFHHRRLQESIKIFLVTDIDQSQKDKMLSESLMKTRKLLDHMLRLVKKQLNPLSSDCIFMATFLWTLTSPSSIRHDCNIRVQGHICESFIFGTKSSICSDHPPCVPFLNYDPLPWTVVVATDPLQHRELPNRYQFHPHAKLSAWCRQRRVLEEIFGNNVCFNVTAEHNSEQQQCTTTCKDSVHVDEILLVKEDTDDHNQCSRLLEGLTSNLFVVYPGNVVRTAGTGVLNGYARQLILDALERRSDYTIDTVSPILLDDVIHWQEVFLSSAIRIVVPVERILIITDQQGGNQLRLFREVWRKKKERYPIDLWRQVYTSILKEQYNECSR